jgi:hypothetical protein
VRVLGLISLVLVLGVGYWVLQQSATVGSSQASPQEQIDVVSIRQQLLVMGQAERQYLASHGAYATLEQLEQDDLLPNGSASRGYAFTALVNGADGFTITASPTDTEKAEWPTLAIDERMRVTEQ